LADKELARLIHSVEQRGAQVLVFLDCCHAGSGTRALTAASVRTCPADDRARPREAYLAGTRGWKATRRETPSGWLPLGKHLLLASCRDDELSYEYRAPADRSPGDNQSQAGQSQGNQWQGAASYFFHRALATATLDTTWAQIHDQILTQVHAIYPTQTPQLEGPSQLTLMGQVGQEVTPYLLVMEVEGDEYVKVNGGRAVGVTPGSRLALYGAGGSRLGQTRPQEHGGDRRARQGHGVGMGRTPVWCAYRRCPAAGGIVRGHRRRPFPFSGSGGQRPREQRRICRHHRPRRLYSQR
jgi:Caspase domain